VALSSATPNSTTSNFATLHLLENALY